MKKISKIPILILSVLSVTACGGGDGSGLASTETGTANLLGTVKVCDASANSKAKVSLPYGDGQGYEVTTNADGSFSLDVDTANFKGVNPVALTVESENCQPENLYVENMASPAHGGKISLPEKIMRNMGPAEFVIPPPWRPLTHLGEDQYGGPANSKLQVVTSGLTSVQPVGVLTQELKDRYRTAYVEFSARGMQTESLQCATQYKNQIGLSATGVSAEAIVKTVQPGASSANGNFTRFSIPVDLSEFPVGSTINFVAGSGQCESGGTDYDDFELTSVLIRFAQ